MKPYLQITLAEKDSNRYFGNVQACGF